MSNVTIDFCGFNENTTVGEVRKAFEDENEAKEIVSNYVPIRKKGVGSIATIIACLLGGVGYRETYQQNFLKYAYPNQDDNKQRTYGDMAASWDGSTTFWSGRKMKSFNKFVNAITPDQSLGETYNIIKDDPNWNANKNEVLNYFRDSNRAYNRRKIKVIIAIIVRNMNQ